MRAVVQRVVSASVSILENSTWQQRASIAQGLVVLVGVEREDSADDVAYVANKIRELRVFDGPAPSERSFERSIVDSHGDVLLVSQFTLGADCRKGRRPAFDRAAPAEIARPLYERLIQELRSAGVSVSTGEFQATMRVALVNDGPVTLLLDSRRTF
jgi:D-tyrosyl-tRNA(Tyr) deacylase